MVVQNVTEFIWFKSIHVLECLHFYSESFSVQMKDMFVCLSSVMY
jgi:hypothetical protein